MTPAALTQRDLWIALAIAATVVVAAGAQVVPGITGVFHDDAIYVAMAKALAEGDGYRLINLPDAPLQRKYPILYPAILAVVWRLWPSFPANVVAMQALAVASAAAFFAGSYLYLVRFAYAERLVAAVLVTLAGTAPFVLFLAGQTLSEMPFAALLVWSLWRLETEVTGPPTAPVAGRFATGLALGLPFACRTIGLAVVAAGLLLLLSRRRLRWATVAGVAVVAVPWVVWTLMAPDAVGRLGSAYYTDYSPPWTMPASLVGTVIVSNAFSISYLVWQVPLLALSTFAFGASGVLWLGFVALTVATLVGLGRDAARGRPLAWVLGAYLLVTVVWPWPPLRFLVPVLPLLLASTPLGLGSATSRVARLRALARTLGLVAAVAAVVANLVVAVAQTRRNHERRYPRPGLAAETAPVEWRSFEELFSWVRLHTKIGDVLATGLDSMAFLYTGRPAVRPFQYRPDVLFYGAAAAEPSADELLDFFAANRVSHLIFTPLPLFAEEATFNALVLRALRDAPGALTLVHRARDPRFMIFQVNSCGGGSQPCASDPQAPVRSPSP